MALAHWGSDGVIDLHGRLDEVVCLLCSALELRVSFQQRLREANPNWMQWEAAAAPDGDAALDGVDFSAFQVPGCRACDGMLKPDVVFFGENVPRAR